MGVTKNSLIMVFAVVVGLGLNYLFNIALGWLLPIEGYGIYGVAVSLITILSVFVSSGFPLTAAKFLSEEKNKFTRLRIFKTVLMGNLLIALIISGIFLLIYFTLLNFEREFDPIAYLIVLSVIITSVVACYRGALQGRFKFKKLALVNILSTIAKFIGIIFVLFGLGVLGAVGGIIFSLVIALALMVYASSLRFWKVEGLEYKVLTFAFPAFAGTLSIIFTQNIDLLFLKILANSNELVGYYQAALTVARLPFWIASAVIGVMFPYLSSSKNFTYSNKALKYFVIFLVFPCIFIFLAPSSFISLIFPERYLEASTALSISVIAIIFLMFNYAFMNILQAIGKPEIPAKILLSSLFLQVIFLYFLIPRISILGAPLSTAISMMLAFVMLLYYYLKHSNLEIKIVNLLKFVFASSLSLICFLIIPHFSEFFLIVNLFISFSLYLSLLITLKLLDKKEIEMILKNLKFFG